MPEESIPVTIALGQIATAKNGKKYYVIRNVPFQDGEHVAVLRSGDVAKMVALEVGALLRTAIPMAKEVYTPVKTAILPDEIIYSVSGEEHKLFLDRTFYTPNHKEQLFARWVSVDRMTLEGLFK